MADSANRDFNSCIVATGLAAATATAAVAVAVAVTVVGGFRGSGLVDLSTLGRPVDPVEGIVCRKVTKSRGRGSGAKGRASRHILKNCPREPADQQTRYRVWDLGLKQLYRCDAVISFFSSVDFRAVLLTRAFFRDAMLSVRDVSLICTEG